MKNISRRVFIKGMAVAAVATAASTVLTGCKLPGTEVEEPIVDTTNQAFTIVDPADSKKSLVITASKMEYNSTLVNGKKVGAIDLKLVNDLQADVHFTNSYVDNKVNSGSYQVVVSAYLDDEEGKAANIEAGTTTYADNFVTTDASTKASTANGTNTVTTYGKVVVSTSDTLKWSKVTVKMAIYKVAEKNSTADGKQLVKTVKASFNV